MSNPISPAARSKRARGRAWALIGASAFFVICGIAAYLLGKLPRRYLAVVTMEVQQVGAGTTPAFSPSFVKAQMGALREPELLRPVVERLGLRKYYAAEGQSVPPERAVEILRGAMKVTEVRHTGLVEVGVYDVDSQMAAEIANAIAVEYRNARMSEAVAVEPSRGATARGGGARLPVKIWEMAQPPKYPASLWSY